MKKDEIKVGGTYLAKVTDRVVPVRIDAENARGGWDATNLATNKKVRIKSVQRLRGAVNRGGKGGDDAAEPTPAEDRKPPAKAPKGKKRANADAKPKKLSLLDAAAQVLKAKGEPMNCKAMVATVVEKGMWKTSAPTPEATLYSAILRDLKKGKDSRFKKTDRGHFTLVEA